jgi:hypothetical protein
MAKIYEVEHRLVTLMKNAGLKPILVKRAMSGSVYYRFADERLGKLRIGDHNERERYGYRWQVRLDLEEPSRIDTSKGHRRFFYRADNLKDLVRHMRNYLNAILRAAEETGDLASTE